MQLENPKNKAISQEEYDLWQREAKTRREGKRK